MCSILEDVGEGDTLVISHSTWMIQNDDGMYQQ